MVIFLGFEGKFETGVDLREAGGKLNVSGFLVVLAEDTEGVIHVNLKSARDRNATLLSDFDRFSERVVHPNFRDNDHEGKTDGT